jgi:hypothetical protein
MIIVGFGIYMFMLYKEVQVFQGEIELMRVEIDSFKIVLGTAAPTEICNKKEIPVKEKVPGKVVIEEDCDSASVTSNDIKNILTNMCNIDGIDEEDHEHEPVCDEESAKQDVKPEDTTDYSAMSKEDLQNVKYDDLRTYLRKIGQQSKGNKAELVNKILEIKV